MKPGQRHDEYLAANGWREWRTGHHESHDRCWYKRVDTPTRCKLNDDKPGMQVGLYQWDFTRYSPAEHVGYQLELRGERVDDRSVRISTSISDDELPEVLDAEIEKLLVMWEAVNDKCRTA